MVNLETTQNIINYPVKKGWVKKCELVRELVRELVHLVDTLNSTSFYNFDFVMSFFLFLLATSLCYDRSIIQLCSNSFHLFPFCREAE